MRKIILAAFLFVAVSAKSQTTSITYSFCVTPPLTVNSDSATLSAQLVAADGYKGISWIQASGPSTSTIGVPINTYGNTMTQKSVVTIHKMIPGTYVFTATGTSAGGISYPLSTTVTVIAQPVPRTVVSSSFTLINGVWVQQFKFSDGTIQ